MHLPATHLLALTQLVVFAAATPIPNIASLKATLQARQPGSYFGSDDSGAIYQPGTAVPGTTSFRDTDGIYHDITRRIPGATTRDADGTYHDITRRSENASPLWVRAQAALTEFLSNKNAKRNLDTAQQSQLIAERGEGDQALPAQVAQKIDNGERIFF